MLVDFDRIEPSNLSRMVLFDERDMGRAKVEVAAERLRRLNPDLKMTVIDGDLFYDVGLGQYRHSDLVIGCLDNLAARSQVGLSCVLAGKPYLDGGMWSLGGEVRWFMAGDGPCFDCTMEASDWARADDRRSCSGFRDPAWDASARQATARHVANEKQLIDCGAKCWKQNAFVKDVALPATLKRFARLMNVVPKLTIHWVSLGFPRLKCWPSIRKKLLNCMS